MKKIINAVYDGLIAWGELLYEYRKSNAIKHYY